MPLFAGLFVEAMVAFGSYLATVLTEKVAIATAATTILTGLLVGVYVAGRSLLTGALTGIGDISPMFGAGVAMVISPRGVALITAYIGFWAVCELYKVKVTLLKLWTGNL